MANYGSRLFSRNKVLTRYLDELPARVHATIGALLDKEEHSQAELLKELRPLYLLAPLVPSELMHITVDHHPLMYFAANGDKKQGYFAQGHVPYTGTRLLWQVTPQSGFRLGLRGKVGTSAVKLCDFLDNKDVAPLGTRIEAELARLAEALLAFRPLLERYNGQILRELEFQVRTY